MKILITGARPFLWLSLYHALLRDGHQVIMHTSNSEGVDVPLTIELLNSDLLDIVACEEVLEGVDLMIHSGLELEGKSTADISDQLESLACLVNVAIGCPMKIIHISDVRSMGYHPKKNLYVEDTAWNQTKDWSTNGYWYHYAEREIFRGISEGLDAWIVRPSNFIASPNAKAQYGQRYCCDDMAALKSGGLGLVSINDVTAMIQQIIRRQPAESVFICNGHNVDNQILATALPDIRKKKSFGQRIKNLFSFGSKASMLGPISDKIFLDNSRSLNVLDMKYQNLKDTLKEFS